MRAQWVGLESPATPELLVCWVPKESVGQLEMRVPVDRQDRPASPSRKDLPETSAVKELSVSRVSLECEACPA